MKTDLISGIRQNWAIIMTIAAVLVAWATLSARVDTNAKEVANVRTLIERVIILEEHDKNIVEDISEIKADLKIIKQQTR